VQGVPKSGAGDRTVALDAGTVADIRRHRREQATERENAAGAVGSGFEFTDEHGAPLHPADVTRAFHVIAYLAGLPPVRLHDLRHGAATLLLAAGYDMKVVQGTLGLSSITVAADTYTSVLPPARPPVGRGRRRPHPPGSGPDTATPTTAGGSSRARTPTVRPASRLCDE